MNEEFSVLLSIYKNEKVSYLKESLDSIFFQNVRPKQVVLVEDGPLTDELNTLIDQYELKYPEFKVVKLPQNVGLGRALNEGLKYCSFELVARMDTDDIAKPLRFEKQLEVFKNNPNLDVVGSWIDEFEDSISNVVSTRKVPEHHLNIVTYAKKRNPLNHPAVMFKKTSVERAGGYVHCLYFEDYYLWVRMLLSGAKLYNIQESLLYFRFSPEMFKRRAGVKYAINEAKFQYLLYNVGFIPFLRAISNILIRLVTRIIPNNLRTILYKNFLR